MGSFCWNYVIITHDDKDKLYELYQESAGGNFFYEVMSPPMELRWNSHRYTEAQCLEKFGVKSLSEWKIKNWGTRTEPMYESDNKKISANKRFFTFRFDTKVAPPIGIYEELHRKGFMVKAYYCDPLGACYCGSYIYGVHEYCKFYHPDQDVPPDIDWCFGVEQMKNDYIADCKKVIETQEYSDSEVIVSEEYEDDDNMAYFEAIADTTPC